MKKENISISKLQKYFDYFKEDCLTKDHSRYKSWEHCKKVFEQAYADFKEGKDIDVDFLSLHLGFYLASWGMMRGSTELLQRDYKIHHKAVSVILKNYELNNLTLDNISKNWSKIAAFREELEKAYKTSGNDSLTNLTDTLVTKIIMGVYGIVPAYDNFVCKALKKYNFDNAAGTYNENSIKAICNYFSAEEAQKFLTNCQNEISTQELIYPQMKIIDMILWEIGAHIKEPFSEIWKKILKYEGKEFLTIGNEDFKYRIENECFIPLNPQTTPINITKDHLEKAYNQWPVEKPSDFSKDIMATSYIWGLFNDERIIKKEDE